MEGKSTSLSWYRVGAGLCAALALMVLFVGRSDAQTGSIIINEVMGDNSSTLADGAGDFEDWIELYNPTDAAVDIGGWFIGDESAVWSIPVGDPDTVIPAGGYVLIWASDKGDPTDGDFPGPTDELHANFKISSTNGDTITLLDPANGSQQLVVPGMAADESYSLNSAGEFELLPAGAGTPNAANGTAVATPTPTPTPTSTPLPMQGDPSIVIYEVMASNDTTAADGAGDFEDWFELYNPTCNVVDIGGWAVADSAEAWTIPAGTVLNPGDVLVLWASNKGDDTDADFPGPVGELHTNFKLGASGEQLLLIDDANLLIDSITPEALLADESWGESGGVEARFSPAQVTFGALNPGDTAPVCTATPTVTPTITPTVAALTPTPTATVTPTATATVTDPTPTVTPTVPGPTPTVTPTVPGPTPTVTPTVPGPTPTATATVAAPTATATVAEPTATATTAAPTATATATLVAPTATATVVGPTPTATATVTAPAPCSVTAVINELAPRGTSLIDGDGDAGDWIELFNPGSSVVDLSTWSIADSGAVWPFPAGTVIAPNGYLVVWASDKGDPDDNDFPGPVGELHTNFKLSGSGETVSLTDGTGCEVDQVSYPALEDGETYGRQDDGVYLVYPFALDTPGAANGPNYYPTEPICIAPDQPVRINRVVAKNESLMADVEGDFSDFIELYNDSFSPYSVSSWYIRDDRNSWEIPWGTDIEGKGTLIIWASGKGEDYSAYPGPEGQFHTQFKLSGDGEKITLSTAIDCLVDEVIYPELDDDEAYGYNDFSQLEILLPEIKVEQCAAPGSARISAVQAKNDSTRADEDGDFGDWIQLINSTDESIDLSGWLLSDGADEWTLPAGTELTADAKLLVWADEKDRGGDGAALHTNFKLGGDGETVSLRSSAACPVDEVTYPTLDDDQQYALGADGDYVVLGGAETKNDKNEKSSSASSGDVAVTATCIAINEVMAKNDTTLDDEDGEFGDWIELVNLGVEVIDLSGYTISDEETAWSIPDGVEIDAGAFLLLWADEGDRQSSSGDLHTNFKLGGNGEPVTLADADGAVAASISTYPEIDDDESFGVDADGNYVVNAAGSATPGEGPAPQDGCDFELTPGGNADPVYDEAADGESQESGTNGETAGQGGGSGSLALTGQSFSMRSLIAQLLIVTGVSLVAIERIASRRRSAADQL